MTKVTRMRQLYFQNVFKKHFGMTPLQYRKKTRT
jgi:AraC-like DNA-binding protein